jgi:hypothetical protein
VFAGMLIATLVGIFFIPLFFSVIARFAKARAVAAPAAPQLAEER